MTNSLDDSNNRLDTAEKKVNLQQDNKNCPDRSKKKKAEVNGKELEQSVGQQ